MTEQENLSSLGKKIFFLYPSGVVQNQIMSELAQEEFEVYSVKDEVKLKQVLVKFPDSIVFANINDGMKENAWEEWIRLVMANPETSSVAIGIITSGADENVRRKYVDNLKIRCGYTVLRPDLGVVLKQLILILNNVNAKGRRKYIRALTDKESHMTANFPMNGTYINGALKDISVVGFSCSFKDDPEFTRNRLFEDIQMRLQAQLLKIEGIIFGSRMDGDEKTYVVLFTQRVDPSIKSKIRKFIQSYLQNKMDNELK